MVKMSLLLGGVAGRAQALPDDLDPDTTLRVDYEHSIFSKRYSLTQLHTTPLPFSIARTGGLS